MRKCKIEELKELEDEIKTKTKEIRFMLDDIVDDIDGLIIDLRERRVNELDELELRLIDIRDSIRSEKGECKPKRKMAIAEVNEILSEEAKKAGWKSGVMNI